MLQESQESSAHFGQLLSVTRPSLGQDHMGNAVHSCIDTTYLYHKLRMNQYRNNQEIKTMEILTIKRETHPHVQVLFHQSVRAIRILSSLSMEPQTAVLNPWLISVWRLVTPTIIKFDSKYYLLALKDDVD